MKLRRTKKTAIFGPLCIFAGSASAVTPSEKSSINTNRKSTTRFPNEPKMNIVVLTNPPPSKGGGAQKLSQCPKSEQ